MTTAVPHTDPHIHRAVPADGPEIAGRVHGQGAPLVLVHGAMDDGEQDWGAMLPFLSEQFTCYVISTRGRGLSGDHADHAPVDLVSDVTAFAESIGEPVGLAGISGGARLVLGAAAGTSAVAAVAAYEPVAFEAMSAEDRARFAEALTRMQDAARRDRPTDAARIFMEYAANDEEYSALAAADGLETAARYVPVDMLEFRLAFDGHGPSPTDPSVLEQVRVPALLLQGTRSAQPWFFAGIRHAARHIPDARVRELAGVGHLAPVIEPERVADELLRFFGAELAEARAPGTTSAPRLGPRRA